MDGGGGLSGDRVGQSSPNVPHRQRWERERELVPWVCYALVLSVVERWGYCLCREHQVRMDEVRPFTSSFG